MPFRHPIVATFPRAAGNFSRTVAVEAARQTNRGERCCHFGRFGRSRKLLLAVCIMLVLGPYSMAGEGVSFPANRFDAEEAGYFRSYLNVGGGITAAIDYIQYHHYIAEYWLSIHDPSAAFPHQQNCLNGLRVLKERMAEKEHWLEETLPPPAFKKFHESAQYLAKQLLSTDAYGDIDPALRASFREMNSVKLEMDERPEQPSESPPPGATLNVIIRPLFLPIVYNVTTGQWYISAVVTTPLGTVTFNLVPDTPSNNIGTGPSLLKVVIADKARYVVVKPRTSISFRDDQLRILEYRTESDTNVLILKPIVSPQEKPPTRPSAPNFDRRKEVRRAIPVYPKRIR